MKVTGLPIKTNSLCRVMHVFCFFFSSIRLYTIASHYYINNYLLCALIKIHIFILQKKRSQDVQLLVLILCRACYELKC